MRARAADMVSHARDAFGNRLIGVAIGNEPAGSRMRTSRS